MKKKWHFTERLENVTVLQFYTVEAETEAEALAMVEAGYGFFDSWTEPGTPGDITLVDVTYLPENDPEFDSAGFSIADRFEDIEEDTHHCDDPGCNCSI